MKKNEEHTDSKPEISLPGEGTREQISRPRFSFSHSHRLYLAPMAGATNTVFRQICRQMGADVLTSEMVSAEGILHCNERTRHYIEFAPAERPFGIQLFGANPEKLVEATRFVIARAAPDFIDLNFGCPVNKVVGKNGGSSVLRDFPLMARITQAVVQAAEETPVTAKIRTGWDANHIVAVEAAQLLEACGVRQVTIHGRTRAQGYAGEADWEPIAQAAAAIKIPVIGNGDIRTGEDALQRIRETGVAGLMIGRAAMASPWVFAEIRAALAGKPFTQPTREERVSLILEHCRREIEWRGAERPAIASMRSRLMAYARGLGGGATMRDALATVRDIAGVEKIFTA